MRTIKKWISILLVLVFVFLSGKTILDINERILPVYRSIAQSEVRNATVNIMTQTLRYLDYQPEDLLIMEKDHQGRIIQIMYDTVKINELCKESIELVQDALIKASHGEQDPYSQLVYYHKGIIYEVPLGYFTNIALFSHIGPKLKVYMEYLNDIQVKPVIQSKPYGMNSTLITIELQLITGMSVVSPFVYERIEVQVAFPLVVQLVKGEAIYFNSVGS